jgi:hypothetical protein
MDNLAYYFVGLLTGVSVTAYFIGKKWYKYYTKYNIQKKQLDRISKLNDNVEKFKDFEFY